MTSGSGKVKSGGAKRKGTTLFLVNFATQQKIDENLEDQKQVLLQIHAKEWNALLSLSFMRVL